MLIEKVLKDTLLRYQSIPYVSGNAYTYTSSGNGVTCPDGLVLQGVATDCPLCTVKAVNPCNSRPVAGRRPVESTKVARHENEADIFMVVN